MANTDRPAQSEKGGSTTDTPSRSNAPQQSTAPGTRSPSGTLSRREPFSSLRYGSPFGSLFQRWNEEMDRLFEDFGFGGGSLARGGQTWTPQIEMFQRGNDLIVRADLPGMKKEDVQVEINEHRIVIQGERRSEHEEEREGWFRAERSYGSFSRTIPLPEGTIADSAKASFKNGVLEITLQAPPRDMSRGRRVNIE